MQEYNGPYFYIQMGHQEHNRSYQALTANISSGVIASPKNLDKRELKQVLKNYKSLNNVDIYIDPQFYNPTFRATKGGYPFNQLSLDWDQLEDTRIQEQIVDEFLDYQNRQEVDSLILPISYIYSRKDKSQMRERVLRIIDGIVSKAQVWRRDNDSKKELLMPLLLSNTFIEEAESRITLINRISSLDVDGFTVIFINDQEQSINNWHPQREETIIGILDTIFRLKQRRFKVLNSYSSLVSFLAFPFGLDCFASGGYSNRRSFNLKEWVDDRDDMRSYGPNPRYWTLKLLGDLMFPRELNQKSKNEIDLIFKAGLWSKLRTPTYYDSELFAQESPIILQDRHKWKITKSFLHYFHLCDILASQFVGLNLEDRINLVRELLNQADRSYQLVRERGIKLNSNRDGSHIEQWRDGFEKYLLLVKDELRREFK